MIEEEAVPATARRVMAPPVASWSVAELRQYISELRAEITRAETEISRKECHKLAAEAFFRRPDGVDPSDPEDGNAG
jgi:uncharacterized small protein (DUF1192 family)